MEIEVREEKENPFFERKELKLDLKHLKSKTPAKQELIKELASKYSAPEENVVIDFIFTKKGMGESYAKAKIYKEKPKAKEKAKKEVKSETQTSKAE